MQAEAFYFDGLSARDQPATLRLDGETLIISRPDETDLVWQLAGLHAIDAPAAGQPFRLTHAEKPGARLVLRDQAFADELLRRKPALHGGYTVQHLLHVMGWTAAGLVTVAALGYLLLTLLPVQLAVFLPDSWRERTGQQILHSVTDGTKECSAPAGVAAMNKMIESLSANGNKLPKISVKVYSLDIMNAFAVSGGHVIVTKPLLDQAESPDELAGVLAHEIGHVAHFHPEQQMLRIAGLQIILSAISGGTTGDVITNVAGLAALLRYSREAEAEADTYARETLVKAAIDPMALKSFFDKITKLEGKETQPTTGLSTLRKLGDIFASHPDTQSRIKALTPLPTGVTAHPSLSSEDWQALKAICG